MFDSRPTANLFFEYIDLSLLQITQVLHRIKARGDASRTPVQDRSVFLDRERSHDNLIHECKIAHTS